MGITVIAGEAGCRIIFSGSLTFEFADELEDRILDALRRYTRFEVDLAAVREIDLCGVHLLGMLQAMGGPAIEIVARSAVVERTSARLLASHRGAWLRGGNGRDAVGKDGRQG